MFETAHDELVAEIQARGSKGAEFNSGIITADRYLRTLQECVGSDMCYRFASKGNVSFQDQLTKATSTLTYNNPDMVVDEQVDFSQGIDAEDIYGDKIVVPKNCLLVFKHTLTSPKKDRDGDILRTQGARVDPKMLLLFQHTHTLPIGKMLGVAEHTKNRLKLYSAVVDINELAHDSAVMIDNQMGRFSHGFRALDFMKVKEDDGHGKTTSPGGFDVKSFEIMEESLVSVPSNTDATTDEIMLSLVEGKKVKSQLLKSYGQKIREKRPISVNVPGSIPIDLNITVNTVPAESLQNEELDETAIETAKSLTGTKCGCGCNGAPGGCGGTGKKPKPAPEKTNDESATEEKAAANNDVNCPECGAKMNGAVCAKCGYGKTGKEAPVEGEKAGRVLSGVNSGKLRQAADYLMDLHTNEPLISQNGKARIQAAHGLLSEILMGATSSPIQDAVADGAGERATELTVKDVVKFCFSANEADQKKVFEVCQTLHNIHAREKRAEAYSRLKGN